MKIQIPILSIHTGSQGRDKTVHRTLGYPNYPYIYIELPSGVSLEPILKKPQGKIKLPLLLRIHGREKSIPFEITWKWLSSQKVSIEVRGKTSFQEFSLEKPSFLLGHTEEEIFLGGKILFYKRERIREIATPTSFK